MKSKEAWLGRQPDGHKLTRASEYKAVLAAPCRLSGNSFLLRAESNVFPNARLGLIASRKAARRAVDRNRGKRLAREAFRAAVGRLPALDVVLQLRSDLRGCTNGELRRDLDRLLRDAALRFGATSSVSSLLARPAQRE